jgi:2-iminobutanoate/2-iminopropanoate deaminase
MSPERKEVRRIVAAGLTEPSGATWSNCLLVGREVVMSGVTSRGALASTAAQQARVIFSRIEAMLQSAGGGLRNVYKLVIYVTDMAFKDDVNTARGAAFRAFYPASTFIAVTGFAFADSLVEIDAFANLDADLQAAAR